MRLPFSGQRRSDQGPQSLPTTRQEAHALDHMQETRTRAGSDLSSAASPSGSSDHLSDGQGASAHTAPSSLSASPASSRVSLLKLPAQPSAVLRRGGEILLRDATLGRSGSHTWLRVGSSTWRGLLTSTSAFVTSTWGFPGASGALRMAGFAAGSLGGPWLTPRLLQAFTPAADPAARDGAAQARYKALVGRSMLGLLALQAMLDPVGQAGALVGGAGGLMLGGALGDVPGAGRLLAQPLPWLMMEGGRVGLPMLVDAQLRGARIKALETALAGLPEREEAERAWTQMAFVGSHLSADTGHFAWAPSAALGHMFMPVALLGRFASHQSLNVSQQFERGYDAFSFEFIGGHDGALLSSHSNWWTYGSLEDSLRPLAEGLAAHPEAVVVVKLSPQGDVPNWRQALVPALERSGLLNYTQIPDHLNYFLARGPYILPDGDLTKAQLRSMGTRAIVVLENDVGYVQSTYSAVTLAQLDAEARDPELLSLGTAYTPRLLNLFSTWGFEPWSERVNFHLPALLQQYGKGLGEAGHSVNIVLANDLETSGLLAFKRLYNSK